MEGVRLPSGLVQAALAYAAAHGADVSALPSFPQSGDLPVVSALEARELLDHVSRLLDEPLLGIRLAQAFERGRYGVVEFACRSAPNIKEALERIVRFLPLVSAPGAAEMVATDSGATLRFRFPGIQGTLGRHGNEFFAALIWLRGREYTGATYRYTKVGFEHAAPPPPVKKAVEAFFEIGPLEFGGEWNEVGLTTESLALPITSYEPMLLPLLDKMAEEAVKARATTFDDEVAQHVRAALPNGEPSLDDIAKRLGMSGRTLQRRLTDSGRPFADVVDSVRHELAMMYVREPSRSLDEVATMLGYAGARPFQRAFKRWTGMTPLEYRRAKVD